MINKITNAMVRNIQVYRNAGGQENPGFYGTRKCITIFKKGQPMVHILCTLNPVHDLVFYFPTIHFNIILSSKSGSPK
jgi:hypothetical protein